MIEEKIKYEIEPLVVKSPVEILTDLLQNRGANLRKPHLPIVRFGEPPCAAKKKQIKTQTKNTKNTESPNQSRAGRRYGPTRGGKHLADGVGVHGGFHVDHELKPFGAYELHRVLLRHSFYFSIDRPSFSGEESTNHTTPISLGEIGSLLQTCWEERAFSAFHNVPGKGR